MQGNSVVSERQNLCIGAQHLSTRTTLNLWIERPRSVWGTLALGELTEKSQVAFFFLWQESRIYWWAWVRRGQSQPSDSLSHPTRLLKLGKPLQTASKEDNPEACRDSFRPQTAYHTSHCLYLGHTSKVRHSGTPRSEDRAVLVSPQWGTRVILGKSGRAEGKQQTFCSSYYIMLLICWLSSLAGSGRTSPECSFSSAPMSGPGVCV